MTPFPILRNLRSDARPLRKDRPYYKNMEVTK